jgi:hypothetical protein
MRIAPWLLIDGQSVMNVLPILWRCVSWMDTECFHGIDDLEDFFDLGPAGEAQERFSARTHIRDCRITSPGLTARRTSMRERAVP